MVLKCKLCGNETESFLAKGQHIRLVEDTVWHNGRINDFDYADEDGFTLYSRLECCECDAETEDIEGAEEWLKENSNK